VSSTKSVIDVGSNTIHLLVGEVKNGVVLPVAGGEDFSSLGFGGEGREDRVDTRKDGLEDASSLRRIRGPIGFSRCGLDLGASFTREDDNALVAWGRSANSL